MTALQQARGQFLTPVEWHPTVAEEQYLATLSEKERMAFEIARSHLASLFSLKDSNAFLAFYEKELKPKV